MIVTSSYKLKIGTTNVHFAVKVESGEWSSLESAYLQPYNSLASLASALGNAQTHHLREDADGLLSKGIYLADGSGTSYNAPSDYGILITDYAGSSGSYWYLQRFFRTDGNMYVRTKQGSGNWDSWYLFTGTVVQ